MKKYSKEKLKMKRWIKCLIAIFFVIIIISLSLLVFVSFRKSVTISKIDDSASFVSDDIAANSTPIIVNNLIVGATYDKKWISSDRYYLNNKATNVEIDAYSSSGKMGKYTINKVQKDSKTSSIYTTISRQNLLEEYFAVSTSENNAMPKPASKVINVTDQYIEYAKDGLGIYRIYNNSIKINEVYDIIIQDGKKGVLMSITNQPGKGRGAYSAIIFVDESGKSRIVKYSYIKDLKNAEDFPVYSIKFVADLNYDSVNEVIIQETKEFEVKYDVLEYKNGKFYEILTSFVK